MCSHDAWADSVGAYLSIYTVGIENLNDGLVVEDTRYPGESASSRGERLESLSRSHVGEMLTSNVELRMRTLYGVRRLGCWRDGVFFECELGFFLCFRS